MADELRKELILILDSDEWMQRHFGIAAHAHDVVDALLPVVRRHIEQARADEREAAARRVWSAYGGCCRPYHKRDTCPYDQHAIGIMRVALGAERYSHEESTPEIEAAIGRIIAEQDHRRAAADELSRLGQEIDT